MLFLVFVAEAIGVPAPTDMVSDELSLDQVIGDLGATFVQANDALAKSTSTLGDVHQNVLPMKEVPSTADGFADVLGPGVVGLSRQMSWMTS